MKEKREYTVLKIYALEAERFLSHITFLSKNKSDNLKKLIHRRKRSNFPSNWETIPFDPEVFKKVRTGLGFSQNTSGNPSGVNSIENGYSRPTHKTLSYFVKLFKKKDTQMRFQEEIKQMELLLSEDIAWDHIKELKEMPSDADYFYDLSVEGVENFIGNGIIVHNTHGHTTMTGSIKNAFGGLITEKRHHAHKVIDEILVDLLHAQKDIHTGIFSVMDGTVCGNGAGPRTMEPVIKNYILASGDCVALDAVSAHLMGFDPMKVKHLKLAHDLGLGCADLGQIDIAGVDIRNVNFHFETKKSPVVFFDQILRRKYPFLEPVLFHTPLFKLCILGSEVYHDYLWYPLQGKRTLKKFMKTSWGKKFSSY